MREDTYETKVLKFEDLVDNPHWKTCLCVKKTRNKATQIGSIICLDDSTKNEGPKLHFCEPVPL